MQPQNTENRGGLEQLPAQPTPSGERIPVLPSPEGGIETGVERREQAAEAQAAAADAASSAAPAQPIVVATPTAPVAEPTTAPTLGPLTAADEDVIEKEWVDKAKQIITETHDDPYQRSNRVNQLQKEYLKKRYGKDLGAQAS